MEDYDPTQFQRTTGDALAAWALFTILFTGILVGSLINSNSGLDEQKGPLAADNIHGSIQANVPAHTVISLCDRKLNAISRSENVGQRLNRLRCARTKPFAE
jgi:hypothetical protein